MTRSEGTVYLLHFSTPYHHAAHYLGWTPGSVEDRIAEHQAGRGARLMEVIVGAGIGFEIARTWKGDRRLERRLKNRHGAGRFCPLCQRARRRR